MKPERPEQFSALIPFSGFYQGVHDDMFDTSIESLFEDSNGDQIEGLAERFWTQHSYNSKVAMDKYSKAYVDALGEKIGIPMEYEETVSPREYNFITDRVFAKVSRASLAKMLRAVRGKRLNDTVAAMFTTRDGFISSYPNHVADWPRISEWDHNQVGAVVAAFVEQNCKDLQSLESEIAHEHIGTEEVDNIINESLTPAGERIANVAYYLRRRQDRKWAQQLAQSGARG